MRSWGAPLRGWGGGTAALSSRSLALRHPTSIVLSDRPPEAGSWSLWNVLQNRPPPAFS
ncbi:hypothetical protein C8Q76DRAFT_702818 [Earliella scabrosa]|nr:hypothetical protein C8Q76DRAFT_702818 [Earliella scabrosa]